MRRIAVSVLVISVILAAGVLAPAYSQFETRSSFLIPGTTDPYSLLVGDFNGDGILDLAVLNSVQNTTGSVEIWFGNGNGTFRQGATYSLPLPVFFGATADLRNNGLTDLVVAPYGGQDVYVLLGNGDGTFQVSVAYPAGIGADMVAVGRFTSGQQPDVLLLEENPCNCLQVLPGNGDGTLGTAITTPLPFNMAGYAVTVGDLNNDGKLDAAVSGTGDTSIVAIMLGNGDGTFTVGESYEVGEEPESISTGFFTANKKKIDLVVGNEEGYSISVLLGNGDGTFQPAANYDTHFPGWVIAQDFSGDGKTDIAAANALFPPGVTVFHGNGDGTFQPGVFYPAGQEGNYIASGDFNGDHRPDLVEVDHERGVITTLLNTGVVSFSPTTPLNFKKQAVGKTSAPQSVTLTNTGATELKIQSMTASTEFAVTSTCGERVAAGANCTISATFSPTKQGAVQGTISIIDYASSKPQVIELLGTGT